MTFDPDAAAKPGSGIFGLSTTRDDAKVVLILVPFDATTSYARGTAKGPDAILRASAQVDLYDLRFGRVYETGFFMEKPNPAIRRLSASAGVIARRLIARGGADLSRPADRAAAAKVDRACEQVNAIVERSVQRVLDEGKLPALVGGEHAVSLGALNALARRYGEFGILQVDAHMDLRQAFEGFTYSHASIMHNALTRLPQIVKLVQVGIRDFGERELQFASAQAPRVATHYDEHWAERLMEGTRFSDLCRMALEPLPQHVYLSFDIDGLDPALCPHTGTPVPGGLSFHQASLLIDALRTSGRRVIGFDLVEVAPGRPSDPEWDANVGARLLYKLGSLA